jgi:hypothetical protein
MQGHRCSQNPVTVSRGNTVNLIFKNRDPEKRRLTVNMGEFTEDINGNRRQDSTAGLHDPRAKRRPISSSRSSWRSRRLPAASHTRSRCPVWTTSRRSKSRFPKR